MHESDKTILNDHEGANLRFFFKFVNLQSFQTPLS